MSVENKLKNSTVLDQAVAYHLPFWEKFPDLKIYQWAWEAARRNPEVQADIHDYKKAWLRWHEKNKHLNLTHRDLPDELIKAQMQIEKKHGISFGMFSHEMEMEHPYHWSDKLVGNAWANHPEKIRYLDNDTPGIRKVEITLLEGDHFVLLNKNSHPDLAKAVIDEIYEENNVKFSKKPQFHTKTFPYCFKAYDLRMWAIKNGYFKKDKAGKIFTRPSWQEIGDYLYPGANKPVNTIKGHFESAEKMIYGGYKDLLIYYNSSTRVN